MSTSFDDYVRSLEARINDDEREMLEAARARAIAQFDSVLYQVKRRERVDAFVARAVDHYGSRPSGQQIVTLHPWPSSSFNHDGPCVEIHPRKSDFHFTVLPLKEEVWAHTVAGDVTENPVQCYSSDEVFEYIDGFLC
jgi:hypothetical protein